MNVNNCTHLNWRPVILIKYIHQPFREMSPALSIKRLYLAEHPDGILGADWSLAADERFYPLIQLIGWNPPRDVPFKLPIKFLRQWDLSTVSLIPSGTWVLPYDDEQYRIYNRMQTVLHLILAQVDKAPIDSATLKMLTRLAI